jgi:hypothetical protein
MAKKKTKRSRTAGIYNILNGISNNRLRLSYGPGDVATLGDEWNIEWLLENEYIELVDSPEPVAEDKDTQEIPAFDNSDDDTGGW